MNLAAEYEENMMDQRFKITTNYVSESFVHLTFLYSVSFDRKREGGSIKMMYKCCIKPLKGYCSLLS